MCVKLSCEYLNLDPYFSHSTKIYTYRMIVTLKVHGNESIISVYAMGKIDPRIMRSHNQFKLYRNQKPIRLGKRNCLNQC